MDLAGFVICAPPIRHCRAPMPHALAEDWINLDARGGKSMDRSGRPRSARHIAPALISWLSQSPIILENADHAFYRRFVAAQSKAMSPLSNARLSKASKAMRV